MSVFSTPPVCRSRVWLLLMALLVFYIVIGCFLDGISAVVLTIAVVEPMVRQAGIDLIWFGIFVVVVVEMAQITPPIGFNLFVLQGMTGHGMGYIARAALPPVDLTQMAQRLLAVCPFAPAGAVAAEGLGFDDPAAVHGRIRDIGRDA